MTPIESPVVVLVKFRILLWNVSTILLHSQHSITLCGFLPINCEVWVYRLQSHCPPTSWEGCEMYMCTASAVTSESCVFPTPIVAWDFFVSRHLLAGGFYLDMPSFIHEGLLYFAYNTAYVWKVQIFKGTWMPLSMVSCFVYTVLCIMYWVWVARADCTLDK